MLGKINLSGFININQCSKEVYLEKGHVDLLEKSYGGSTAANGEVRVWGGIAYKKESAGKWKRVGKEGAKAKPAKPTEVETLTAKFEILRKELRNATSQKEYDKVQNKMDPLRRKLKEAKDSERGRKAHARAMNNRRKSASSKEDIAVAKKMLQDQAKKWWDNKVSTKNKQKLIEENRNTMIGGSKATPSDIHPEAIALIYSRTHRGIPGDISREKDLTDKVKHLSAKEGEAAIVEGFKGTYSPAQAKIYANGGIPLTKTEETQVNRKIDFYTQSIKDFEILATTIEEHDTLRAWKDNKSKFETILKEGKTSQNQKI